MSTNKKDPRARETNIKLDINKKIDLREILDGLENYHSPRRPWHWRDNRNVERKIGDFVYLETSDSLKNSVPLPGSRGFGYIDRSRTVLSPLKSLPVALKTISVVCACVPGRVPTISWLFVL